MNNNQNKNYFAIGIMFALFFMIAFVTGLPSPMGVIVAKQFGASALQSQLGFFANFIAYAFMGIPAGIMLKRIGYKMTSLAAVTVGFVGVGVQYLSGVAGSFTVYLLGAFICGFSVCMLNTVVNPMLNTLGGGGNRGNQLIQFGGVCNSVGATIVPYLVGYLMGAEAGRTIEKANPALFIAMGIFAVAFIILAVSKIPEPHMEKRDASKPRQKDQYGPMSFRHFVLGAIAIFIYVGIEIGLPSTANLYMTQHLAIDATIAGSIVSMYWLFMLVGRLIGAPLAAKVSSKKMLTFVSILGLVFVTAAIFMPETLVVTFRGASVPVSVVFIILCGLCTSVMWGGIFNLAVEGLGKYTAAASGIFMVLVCGGGIIPTLQGWVADMSGYLASYWVQFACLGYLLYYALSGCRNVNTDIPVEE